MGDLGAKWPSPALSGSECGFAMALAFKNVELYQNKDNNSIYQHLPAIIAAEKNIDNIHSNRYQMESTYVKVWSNGVSAFAKATADTPLLQTDSHF